MKQAKVCMISTVHFPADVRIFSKQAVSLVRAGYDVSLIIQTEKTEVVEGITIIPLSKPGNRLKRLFITGWQAFREARKAGADLYHFHDPEFIPYALMLRAAGKKVIYDVHEDYESAIAQKEYLPGFARKILAKLFGFFEVFLSKPFTIIIAEKYYIRRFPKGIEVLNYPRKELFDFYIKYADSSDTDIVKLLYTGDITVDRGALIHAGLVNLADWIEVYMFGSCSKELAEKLYQVAGKNSDRLRITGIGYYVPFDEIMMQYRTCGWTAGLAIFQPTAHYYEKELTKFFEYMGAGIPVICSDFPVWRAIVKDNSCGITVDSRNLHEVEEAILYLRDNPGVAEEMGRRGRAAVKSRYNWSAEEKKLLTLYADMLK